MSNESKEEKFLGRKREQSDNLKVDKPECIVQSGDKAFKIKCTVIRSNKDINNFHDNLVASNKEVPQVNSPANIIGHEENQENHNQEVAHNINKIDEDSINSKSISKEKGEIKSHTNLKHSLIKQTESIENVNNKEEMAKDKQEDSKPVKDNINVPKTETNKESTEKPITILGNDDKNEKKISSLFPSINEDKDGQQKSILDAPKENKPLFGSSIPGEDKQQSIFGGDGGKKPSIFGGDGDQQQSIFGGNGSKKQSIFGDSDKQKSIFVGGSIFGQSTNKEDGGLCSGIHIFSGTGTGSIFSQISKDSTQNNFSSFLQKEDNKDNLFAKNNSKDKFKNGKEEEEENSDDDDDEEKANSEPEIVLKEADKEQSPFSKIFTKQINNLFEFNKKDKKFKSRGKGVLSLEYAKINEKNTVVVVYR